MTHTEILPAAAGGRPIIESYGGGGFKIAGRRYAGSILVLPETTLPWPVEAADAITAETLRPVTETAAPVRILIVGCGRQFVPRPVGLDVALRASGIGIEWMDTGAACRTFNVLLLEDRDVAAALIAVD